MKLAITFLLAAVCGAALAASRIAAAPKSYSGYTVLRARVETEEQHKFLEKLRYADSKFDFWAGPRLGLTADIMAGNQNVASLEKLLAEEGIKYSVMVPDVGRLIESSKRPEQPSTMAMNWQDYQSLDTLYAWFDALAYVNPKRVSIEIIGQSYEGRDLKVIKVTNGDGVQGKPAFWIDATIHAREWIATSTGTYFLNQLVNNRTAHSEILKKVDFYFLPVVNPDGYEYSRNVDRMWRKTRSPTIDPECPGVDANRNFGFQWNSDGSSPDPCAIHYCGSKAYSEPEAAAVRDYFLNHQELNWQAFLTLHSYSQLWMSAWGYTKDLPENYDDLIRVGDAATAAITAVSGTDYLAGSAANILYISSGTSRDWAQGEGNFTYVYTIELRDRGDFGFVLPPEQILPTAVETWEGVKVLAREVGNLGIKQ